MCRQRPVETGRWCLSTQEAVCSLLCSQMEGQCLSKLELDRRHYHHVSLCMDTLDALDVPAATGGCGEMVLVNTAELT